MPLVGLIGIAVAVTVSTIVSVTIPVTISVTVMILTEARQVLQALLSVAYCVIHGFKTDLMPCAAVSRTACSTKAARHSILDHIL